MSAAIEYNEKLASDVKTSIANLTGPQNWAYVFWSNFFTLSVRLDLEKTPYYDKKYAGTSHIYRLWLIVQRTFYAAQANTSMAQCLGLEEKTFSPEKLSTILKYRANLEDAENTDRAGFSDQYFACVERANLKWEMLPSDQKTSAALTQHLATLDQHVTKCKEEREEGERKLEEKWKTMLVSNRKWIAYVERCWIIRFLSNVPVSDAFAWQTQLFLEQIWELKRFLASEMKQSTVNWDAIDRVNTALPDWIVLESRNSKPLARALTIYNTQINAFMATRPKPLAVVPVPNPVPKPALSIFGIPIIPLGFTPGPNPYQKPYQSYQPMDMKTGGKRNHVFRRTPHSLPHPYRHYWPINITNGDHARKSVFWRAQ